jgi:site-specific recombinase XerD
MPRARPPYLVRQTTRHGRTVWYVRKGDGERGRIRIKEEYGTPAFWAAYNAAVAGETAPAPGKPKPQSLAWLIAQYRESVFWHDLSLATRRQRENIFKRAMATGGNEPFTRITRATILKGMERRRDTPAAARHFLQAFRGLFEWAVSAQHVEADPTAGVKRPKLRDGDGFAMWPEEWCAAFEARWPIGTRQRVWYEVLYSTGLRRGDAVRVGRPHVKNGRGMIRAQKNGETAYFLVSDRLQAALDAGPIGEVTWIAGESGRPLTKESFGNLFRDACRDAMVPGSAHGLRKTRATIEAENGASEAKLDALFGWRTGSKTSAIYIKKADRARLAFGPVEEPN